MRQIENIFDVKMGNFVPILMVIPQKYVVAEKRLIVKNLLIVNKRNKFVRGRFVGHGL